MSDTRLFFYASSRKLPITEKASVFFSSALVVLRYLCWSSAHSRITGNAADIFFMRLHFACVSAQILTDGDDSGGLVSVSDKMDGGQGVASKLQSDAVGEMEGQTQTEEERDERRQEGLMEAWDSDRTKQKKMGGKKGRHGHKLLV